MPAVLTRTATSVIGVDFGACSLRAMQLQRRRDGWHIHHWASIETEPASPQPEAMDYRAQMPMLFGPATFAGNRTALLLSPPDVEYRLIDAPVVLANKPSAELRGALAFELDRHLAWPVGESEVAAWAIKPDASGTASMMVVAARIRSVQERLDVLAGQQLGCVRADIVPNAMTHVCAPARGEGADEPGKPIWGILDVGFRSARFYLIYGDRPVYARVLKGSGREVTETLAAALHVDFRIAEQYKRIYGIRKTDRGFRSGAGGLSRISEEQLPAVLYAILKPMIEEMVRDMERSFQFALGQLPGVSAGPIYVVGGGARLGGLVEALSGHLGVPVRLPDPKLVLGTGGSQAGGAEHPACTPANWPVLAACAGLALLAEDAS